MRKCLLLACLLVFVVPLGCAKVVPPPALVEMRNANYGAHPKDEVELIKDYLRNNLVDPYSIRDLKIQSPKKCWFQKNEYAKPVFGYCSFLTFNDENKIGGHAGTKEYVCFVRNGHVIHFSDHWAPWQYGYPNL